MKSIAIVSLKEIQGKRVARYGFPTWTQWRLPDKPII
jgi:hypothetical protein